MTYDDARDILSQPDLHTDVEIQTSCRVMLQHNLDEATFTPEEVNHLEFYRTLYQQGKL
jgi:hypothetical protein